MLILVAAAITASSPVETPELVLSPPTDGARLDHVRVDVELEPDAIEATLTLDLATASKDWVATQVAIAVPPGTVATALTLDSEGKTLRGRPLRIEAAHDAYDQALLIKRDPALLEQTDSGLLLHVFPIARDTPASVRIFLRLPRLAGLRVRAGDAPVELVEARGETVPAWMTEDHSVRYPVSPHVALFAAPDPSRTDWLLRRR